MSAIERFPLFHVAINTPNKHYMTGEEFPILQGDPGDMRLLGQVYDQVAKVASVAPGLEARFRDVYSGAPIGSCGFVLRDGPVGENGATDLYMDVEIEPTEDVVVSIPLGFVTPFTVKMDEGNRTLEVELEDMSGDYKVKLDGIIDDYGPDSPMAIFTWREDSMKAPPLCRMLAHTVYKHRHEGQRLVDADDEMSE